MKHLSEALAFIAFLSFTAFVMWSADHEQQRRQQNRIDHAISDHDGR